MRDWVKSKEGLHNERRNRALINFSIVTLFLIMTLVAVMEIVGFISSTAKVDKSVQLVAQNQAQEDSLFALDAVLNRGVIINEFMDALKVSDVYTADSIRTRLASGRQLLLSDGMSNFPKDTRVDLARLLAAYSIYGLNSDIVHGTNSISLAPQADTNTLLNGLQSLRAYQKNWLEGLAAKGLGDRRKLYTKSSVVITLILLAFIPLCCAIFASRYFAKEYRQLSETRSYFVGLINSLPGLVLLTNRRGEILAASKAVTDFLGYSPEWFKQAEVTQLLPKRFQQQYKLYSKNHLDFNEDAVKGRELLLVDASGTEVPVELHFGNFKTHDGDALIVCFRDVSAERSLVQRYQQLQRRFDMVMTASRDGLWDWDLHSNEVIFSASWLEMMGIVGGHPIDGFAAFEDCVFADDRARVTQHLEAFLRASDTLFRVEHRLLRRDGSVLDVVSRACAQRDGAGRVLRMVGMHSDVTSFKQAEREVLRLNAELEGRVNLRTEQLERALLSAEAANKAKTAFLSVMGHEIRTPMNGVIGMADLLAKTALDREQKMMLNTVRESSQSLMTTLDHILDYAVLESGSAELKLEVLQLVEFVEGIADSVAPQLAKNKQRFILHIDPQVPAVVVTDANYLRKVLLNLIDNAIKFSVHNIPHGVVQLRLGLAPDQSSVAADQQCLEIKVIDNGIGISSGQRSKLFEPFVQIENSRARRFGGTGLGLAISARVIKLMGGAISLTSAPGEDTCFTVQIACDIAEAQPVAAKLRDVTVLACVPDKLLRDAVANVIEGNGYRLVCFDSVLTLQTELNGLNSAAIVVAMVDNQPVLDCCTGQHLKAVKLSGRPSAKAMWDLGLVYTDPLLPSALLRALEREQRLANATIGDGRTGLL